MPRYGWLFGACVCLLGLGALPLALAGDTDARVVPTGVVLGTSTPGGGFELFGQHLAEAINASDPQLRVVAMPTRGSRQNLELLETGEIDIGLVEGNAAHRALNGVGRAPADLRVLSVMYPNPGMFAVRAESPYGSIDDLRGRPVVFGTRASGLRLLANDVIDGIGLSPERDFEGIPDDLAQPVPRRLSHASPATSRPRAAARGASGSST